MHVPDYRTWNELNGTEKDQVAFMQIPLKEFSYGYDELLLMEGSVTEGSAKHRFYMGALYRYCFNFFMLHSNTDDKLHAVLESIGSGDLMQPILKILDTPLGTTTLGEIIRTFRNKILTHRLLNLTEFEQRILKQFDFREPENGFLLNHAIWNLFAETKQLYAAIMSRFPEALDHELSG